MHLVYRALERNPVPPTLPAEMIPPSKRKHGAGLAGAVPVMPAAAVAGPAAVVAGSGPVMPGPVGPVVPGAAPAVPLVPGTAAMPPVSTAGQTSPTSVSSCCCYRIMLSGTLA